MFLCSILYKYTIWSVLSLVAEVCMTEYFLSLLLLLFLYFLLYFIIPDRFSSKKRVLSLVCNVICCNFNFYLFLSVCRMQCLCCTDPFFFVLDLICHDSTKKGVVSLLCLSFLFVTWLSEVIGGRKVLFLCYSVLGYG